MDCGRRHLTTVDRTSHVTLCPIWMQASHIVWYRMLSVHTESVIYALLLRHYFKPVSLSTRATERKQKQGVRLKLCSKRRAASHCVARHQFGHSNRQQSNLTDFVADACSRRIQSGHGVRILLGSEYCLRSLDNTLPGLHARLWSAPC